MADGFADEEAPFPEDEELAQGEDDKALLRAVIDRLPGEYDEKEAYAFEGMLDNLNQRRFKKLTPKQRAWLERTAERLGASYVPRGELPIRAADVLRGREVETPAVLRDLPKRPPSATWGDPVDELDEARGADRARRVLLSQKSSPPRKTWDDVDTEDVTAFD